METQTTFNGNYLIAVLLARFAGVAVIPRNWQSFPQLYLNVLYVLNVSSNAFILLFRV